MLKSSYDNKADIPAGFESLYTERGGKWVITGIEGIKTQADVDTLQTALGKEREDHKKTKESLKAFGDLKPDEVLAALDRIPELEAAAGQVDETKIEALVSARVAQVKNPLERELSKLKEQNATLSQEVSTFKENDRNRQIKDQIRTQAINAKVTPEALEDVLLIASSQFELNSEGKAVTKDSSPLGAGMSPEIFFQDAAKTRPYIFPKSNGGGAGGGEGGTSFQNNPWSKTNWNMTEQGRAVTQNRALAEQMAASVGSKIGATSPPEK